MSQYIRAKKSYLYIFLQFLEFHQMSIYQGKKILSLYLFAIPPYVPQLKFILFRKIDREKEMERDYLYSRYMSSLNQRERERERESDNRKRKKKIRAQIDWTPTNNLYSFNYRLLLCDEEKIEFVTLTRNHKAVVKTSPILPLTIFFSESISFLFARVF